jgi:hypothetical protein
MTNESFFRSIGKAPDGAASAFFSERNIDDVQTQIRYEVYNCTGAVIGLQSRQALLSVMEAVYEDHSATRSNGGQFQHGQVPGMFSGPNVRPGVFPSGGAMNAPSETASVRSLNANVLRRVVPNIISGLREHRRYMSDIMQANPTPLEHPKCVSGAGRRQLHLHRH